MSNPYLIKFSDEVTLECAIQPTSGVKTFRGDARSCISIKLSDVSYETINERFVDGATFSVMAWEELPNVSGLPSREYAYVEYAKPDFVVAGDIIDHRDGTYTVMMGKKTKLELLEEENAALLFENLTGEAF